MDLEQRVQMLESQVALLVKLAASGLDGVRSASVGESADVKGLDVSEVEGGDGGAGEAGGVVKSPVALLRRLTLKQHAVVQMIMGGANNVEIAGRLGNTENTVKGMITAILRNSRRHWHEVFTRTQLRLEMKPFLDAMDKEEYEGLSGLPKDWDERWNEKDKEVRPELYELKSWWKDSVKEGNGNGA